MRVHLTRRVRALLALAAVELVVVAVAAHRYGDSGAGAVVAALLLAPCAVAATAGAAMRLGGKRFGLFAAAVYVAMPAIGDAYMLPTYRATFLHGALPALLGLRSPGWIALGFVLVAALAAAPQTIVAAGGAALAAWAVVRYDVGDLSMIKIGLHETAWSIALAEWFVIAGLLGAAWRSWRLALGLGGILAFAVLRAAHHGYDNAAFWKNLALGLPAIALLLSSTALLVPRLRRAENPATTPL